MLPASLIALCSSSPRSFEVPSGRRSMSSERRMAVGFGKTSSVRPVRSPSMFMSTAATGSSGPVIWGGTSSSGAMLIVGTLIMIVPPVICDSADAVLHGVDADAAPRDVGHSVRGREAGARDQADQLLVGELGLEGVHQPA